MSGPVYHLSLPGLPPRANERLVPIVVAGKPALRHRRAAGVGLWQRVANVSALVQLRQQGLWAPLTGRVAVVVRWTAKRPRDVDAGVKDTLDALTGVLWADDRQAGPLALDVRLGEAEGTEVWATVDLAEWIGVVRRVMCPCCTVCGWPNEDGGDTCAGCLRGFERAERSEKGERG